MASLPPLKPGPGSPAATPPRRRLWPWFLAGFLIVFVGMSLTVNAYYMHPSGRAVVRTQLWDYYLVQLPRLFQAHNLGPATGDSAVGTMLLQHLACSAGGGFAAMGLAWGVRRLKNGTPRP